MNSLCSLGENPHYYKTVLAGFFHCYAHSCLLTLPLLNTVNNNLLTFSLLGLLSWLFWMENIWTKLFSIFLQLAQWKKLWPEVHKEQALFFIIHLSIQNLHDLHLLKCLKMPLQSSHWKLFEFMEKKSLFLIFLQLAQVHHYLL